MVILLTCTQLGGGIVVKFGEITKSGAKCGNAYFQGCKFAVWNGDGAFNENGVSERTPVQHVE